MNYKIEKDIRIARTTIHLKVQSDNPNIDLNPWYSKFLPAQKIDRPFNVTVRHHDFNKSSDDQFPEIVFHNNRVTVVSDGYNGVIFIADRCAELEVMAKQPQIAIDYFLRVVSAITVFIDGGFLFHAAGIRKNNKGYAFFGHSGSGKTTVCRLSVHADVLNDDLICLMPAHPNWQIFSTPFTNPTQIHPMNRNAKLHGLFFLVQAEHEELQPMSASRAVSNILANVPIIPLSSELTPQLISRIQKLVQNHQPYSLFFRPEPAFWNLILPE